MKNAWFIKLIIISILWIVGLLFIHRVYVKEYFVGKYAAPWNDQDLSYTNQGKLPWLRYPIHQSTVSDPIIKYKNAYYYEMSNQQYEGALKETFFMKDCAQLSLALQKENWSNSKKPSEIGGVWSGVYEQWLVDFTNRVRASPYLALASDSTTVIQVVHDRWISAYTHVGDPTLLRMDVEVLLYRLGKPHGKHVSMSVIAKQRQSDGVFANPNDWEYTVVAIEIIGVVPEDQIALHPVVANNPFDQQEMSYQQDPATFANTIIPPAHEVVSGVRRHMEQYDILAKTQAIAKK